MKLLVVEDDAKVASAVARGLRAEGFTVEVAADGDEGLWRATEGTYELIVLDVMLPGTNGYRLCAALREAGDWTPILMLTAKDGDHDEAEALDTGADDYLRKPFSFPVLVARIRALLRRARTTEPGIAHLKFGDLEIVPEEGVVLRNGEEVHLTKTEFRLLVELASTPGRVFSREVLLERVWGYGYFGDGRLVDVHVRRLRTKVEVDPANPRHVVTVRGLGYKLQP